MVFKADTERSPLLDFLHVFPGGGVELFEEGFADEGGDSCVVSVPMAPENLKVFWGCPCRLVALRGVSFLDANDIGLCRQVQQFPIFDVLPYQIVGEETLCVP